LHSDQGRQFESLLIREICRLLQINKTRTSPYHPQCDGLAERFNKTLVDMLSTSAKCHPEYWEEYLRPICFAYNTSVQSSTGYTPFFLMYGREARLPVDLSFSILPGDMPSPAEYAMQKA
jgi:transposase InsO family protein